MRTYFVLLFCIGCSLSYAQSQTASISGKVAENQQAIEFASVSLAKLPDSTKVLFFTESDSLGKYHFENVPYGSYILKVSLIGYKTYQKKLDIASGTHSLGEIELQADTKLLNEVQVTAQKKLIQKTTEGFIVNTSANLTQAGGTVTDILKNTPTVAVDADGGITLRGKSPMILVNGRNSNLTNTDQIPASSVESIEIITSATAKYDANAESGIINIVLKKNTSNGTNGALGLGAGSRFRVNSSGVLNHKSKNWNIGIGYDNRFAGRTRIITGNRTSFQSVDNYQLDQYRFDERLDRLQNLKLNVDYQFNTRNTLSFEAIGNTQGQDNDESLQSKFYSRNNVFNSENDRHSVEIRRSKVAEFALVFDRKFEDKQKSFAASLTTSVEKGRENTDIDTQSLAENLAKLGNPAIQRTHNYEDGVISNAKIDYTLPLASQNLLDMGYKGIFRSIRSDFLSADKVADTFIKNLAASSIFNFREQVHALYALLHSKNKSKWNYEVGLRAEQVINSGETQDSKTQFSNDYLKLFPTINFILNQSQQSFWKWSYAKRINRPGLGQLNPFTDITDALNPHSGNPNLKPEIIHAAEFGYNKEWKEYSLSANLFYRYAKNTIRPFFQDLGNGVVLNKPMNIGTSDSYGLENIITGKPSAFYDFNASFSFFNQKINADNIQSDAVQASFNWFGKLINNFVIGKGSKLQLVANYTSATTTPQGKLTPLYFIDFGYQQKIGKNARLGLTVVDAFNTLKSGSKLNTDAFNSLRTSKADTRAVMLSLAYSFKTTIKEKMLENKFSREW
ncbi:MAG TPA: TonB-dependent receptor [Runella sp.]|nr:TonB-dependent receptor [Runella sp.]